MHICTFGTHESICDYHVPVCATPFKRNAAGCLEDFCCFTCRFSVDGTRVKVKFLPEFMAQDYPFIILSKSCTSPRAAFGWVLSTSCWTASQHCAMSWTLSSLSPLSGVSLSLMPLTESSHCLILFHPLVIGIYSNGILLYGSILVSASQMPQTHPEAAACMVSDKHVS